MDKWGKSKAKQESCTKEPVHPPPLTLVAKRVAQRCNMSKKERLCARETLTGDHRSLSNTI